MAVACLQRNHRAIFVVMKSLADIEAAADSLPPEQKEQLLRFLAERLHQQTKPTTHSTPVSRSKRGFPISKGRLPFTSADVNRIEAEA
jgi:hypothetical protein